MNMSLEIERTTTGIIGLDKIICGGLPKPSVTLISGSAGTAKTTFLLQFIWDGLQNKENGLFITLEEMPEEIKKDALQYGWDFEKYEKAGECNIEYFDPFELGDISSRLKDLIIVNNYKRVVIDSTSLFGMYINDTYKVRKKLFKLVQALKSAGCTALLSSEIPEKSDKLSLFGVEEYVVDGVIILYYTGMENGVCRNIAVRKLRLTDYKNGTFPFNITDKGIKVLKDDI